MFLSVAISSTPKMLVLVNSSVLAGLLEYNKKYHRVVFGVNKSMDINSLVMMMMGYE